MCMVKKFESGGEIYYSVKDIYKIINCYIRNEKIIFSVEFFQIVDEKIIPYSNLLSIDSETLYDEEKQISENIARCNGFIEQCLKKCYDTISELYFVCVTS